MVNAFVIDEKTLKERSGKLTSAITVEPFDS